MLQADVKFHCKKFQVVIKKIPADCIPVVLNFFEYQENRPEWKFERFRHGIYRPE